MSLNVLSNCAANIAMFNLAAWDAAGTTSVAKVEAGTPDVWVKDKAASLAISSRPEADITDLQQAFVNVGKAVSMQQIADGARAKVNDILVQIKAPAVLASCVHLSGADCIMLDTKYQTLQSNIDRIANNTELTGTLLVGVAMLSQASQLLNNLLRLLPQNTLTSLEERGFSQQSRKQNSAIGWTAGVLVAVNVARVKS